MRLTQPTYLQDRAALEHDDIAVAVHERRRFSKTVARVVGELLVEWAINGRADRPVDTHKLGLILQTELMDRPCRAERAAGVEVQQLEWHGRGPRRDAERREAVR